ncbi:MAG: hypothetical protein D6826_07965, partial [Alphaproteobacteria bacterium]
MPTPENAAQAASTSATTLDLTLTIGSNPDRFLLVGACSTSTVTGVVFDPGGADERTLTNITTLAVSSDTGLSLWKLVAPPTKTAATIRITKGGGHVAAGALGLYDVDQTTPHDAVVTQTFAAGTDPGVSLASQNADLVFNVIGADGGNPQFASGGGQVEHWDTQSASGNFARACAAASAPGASSVAMSWTLSGTARATGVIALNLNAPAGGTATGTQTASLEAAVQRQQIVTGA